MAVEGRGIAQLTALVKREPSWLLDPPSVSPGDAGKLMFHVMGGVTAGDRRWDSGRNRSNPAAQQGPRSPDFKHPVAAARAPGLTVRRADRQYSEHSLKSADGGPARFHRFQEIPSIRSTPSTAGLYDLYTRCGRTVDKKGTFPSHQNYPQDPPQARWPIYRGFQPYKVLLNQKHSLLLHEIWPYHHHQAFDLYPDLEAREAPNFRERGLWTERSADIGSALIERSLHSHAKRLSIPPGQNCATDSLGTRITCKCRKVWNNSTARDRCQEHSATMLHVEQKKDAREIPSVHVFHVELRDGQRRNGITT